MNTSDPLARAKHMFATMIPEQNPTIADRRGGFDRMLSAFEIPGDTEMTETTIGGVPCIRVKAAGADAGRAIVFTHGGGFVMGSARGYREFAHNISRACDAVVVSVDYRLAPEHPAPAAIDDVLAVYRALVDENDHYAIVLMGDSAGGGVSLGALLAIRDDHALPAAAAAVAMSPVTDPTARSDSYDYNRELDPLLRRENIVKQGAMYQGDLDLAQYPYTSPMDADLSGLPPIFVLVGDEECLLEDSLTFYTRLRRSGGSGRLLVQPRMLHVWPMFASFMPEGRAALEDIGDFVKQHSAQDRSVPGRH